MGAKFDLKKALKIQNELFDVSHTKPRRGTWWWWFFLFIFNNPKNPEKPRQLMILWSTKKDKEIVKLIKTQLKKNWRLPLIKYLNRLIIQYKK